MGATDRTQASPSRRSPNPVSHESHLSLARDESIPRHVAGDGCSLEFRDPMRQSRAVRPYQDASETNMPDLPSGTVIFLFTDIEGSTALWERDRTAMAAAVERHIALLDAVIQAHAGTHFKTIGDSVQAAFPTAAQGVAAAVVAQQALTSEPWPAALGPLRVRMA